MRTRPQRIVLLLSRGPAYNREVLRGIMRWRASGARWVCHVADPRFTLIDTVARWKPEGIITGVGSVRARDALTRLGVPAVNVSGVLEDPGLPSVIPDSPGIGQLAARYYLDRGFRSFGYAGYRGFHYAAERRVGFLKTLASRGLRCTEFWAQPERWESHPRPDWRRDEDKAGTWLASLTRPAAVFCCNDAVALFLAEICRQAGLQVPTDVALLGVDDDQLLCELSTPPISSVRPDAGQIGFLAARLLDKLLRERRPPVRPIRVAPLGITTRASTDMLAIEDADVAEACRLIREHFQRPLGVEELLREVPISRRSLERRFRLALGRTPAQEIVRVRVEHARRLLETTSLSVPEVARRSGFGSGEWMSVVFRKRLGLSPSQCRRK